MRWMKSCAARNEPFFVYLPTNAPHGPCWVPEKYREPYKGKVKPDIADFFGMIANIDENMARLDTMLKESGLYDNTLLIFMTDNGGTAGVPVWNAGMRGGKTEYYDGGHRVPCFVRWPAGGLRQPGDVADLTQCQDLLPTLIDLCGLPPPKGGAFRRRQLGSLAARQAASGTGQAETRRAVRYLGGIHGPHEVELRRDVGQVALVPRQGTLPGGHRSRTKNQRGGSAPRDRQIAARSLRELVGPDRTAVAGVSAHPFGLRSRESRLPRLRGLGGPEHGQSSMDSRRGEAERALARAGGKGGALRDALRRWPAEADAAITAAVPPHKGVLGRFSPGKALPIVKARLSVADVDESKPVVETDKAATFQVHLPAGRTTLQTWFCDRHGESLCGAYCVYVSKLPE